MGFFASGGSTTPELLCPWTVVLRLELQGSGAWPGRHSHLVAAVAGAAVTARQAAAITPANVQVPLMAAESTRRGVMHAASILAPWGEL